MGQNFYICLWSGPTGLPPPLTVCSFVFYDSPKLLIEFQHKMHESVVVLFMIYKTYPNPDQRLGNSRL